MTQVLLAPLTQPDLARHLVTVEPGQTLATIIDRMLPRATEAELASLRVTLVTDAGVQLVPRAL